jgi:hypothetical protein
MADSTDEEIQAAFRAAQSGWADALREHRVAPPDAGYSARLLALSRAAHAEALICWEAHEAGYKWPRHRAAGGEPPYELRPESGRRGPDVAWQRFDAAVEALNRATTGTDLHRVGSAYEEMAVAAGALAEEVEFEDRASGLLPPKRSPAGPAPVPARARKSA